MFERFKKIFGPADYTKITVRGVVTEPYAPIKHKHSYVLAWSNNSYYAFQCTDSDCFNYCTIYKEKFHA